MGDVLLSVSNSHVFYKGRAPVPAASVHKPFFWVFPERGGDVRGLRRSLLEHVGHAQGEGRNDDDPLSGVVELGPVEAVESFWRNESREAFRVFARHPGLVPKISDHMFDKFHVFTAEHDVPYQQRLAVDMAAGGAWPFATGGRKTTLDVVVFDIETTQYGNKGVREDRLPVDVLGHASFPFTYTADMDLETESFDLDIVDAPQDWRSPDVTQHVARNDDEEIDLLAHFCHMIRKADVISGHNVFGFDNLKIHERIEGYLKAARRQGNLERDVERLFAETLDTYLWKDKTYQFGRPDDIAVLHPSTLDTLLAARRFYFFRDDFTLKALAPFLGVQIEDRQYVDAQALDISKPETLRYHDHDVREQLGLSMHFMLQALPLAFSTGMTFEQLFQGMNTKMWDHIGMIRGAYRKRLMPATCRAQAIAGYVQRRLGSGPQRLQDVVGYARGMRGEDREGQSGREFMRVAKYGDEMPEWVEYPHLITDTRENAPEPNGYAIAGGMTLHPQEMGSQFVPWWHVVAADVGAMYPTILKALNVGADTVRLARKGETPDAWVWLKRVDGEFQDSGDYVVRPPAETEEYADRGVMVGIRKRDLPGTVNLGMTAILGMIAKVKAALGKAKAPGSGAAPEDIKRLQLNYASLKAARNAGTHGILVAVNVSCRQFNVLAGAHITTEGQRILHESLQDLNRKEIRVVYGDSITGDRCVVVRDPRGRVRVMPIEELFSTARGEAHEWHGKAAITSDGWEALAMEPESGAEGWYPIRRIICHDTNKPVVRIRQKDGETVCTTDHSVMVRDGEQVIRARPDEAVDKPLVRLNVPRNDVLESIDLLEWVAPTMMQLESSIPLNRLFKTPRRTASFGYDDDWIWFNLHTRPDLGVQRFRRMIKVGSEECSALCRLLGAYVAEGSVTWNGNRRGASIATGERDWLEEIKADVHLLFENLRTSIIESDRRGPREIVLADGTTTTYVDRTLKIQMTNMIAARFFWALAGKGSAGKRVPDFLFSLPRVHQEEFLDAAVRGDGSREWGRRYSEAHKERHFMYTTKSLRLAAGLSTLLGQLGVDYGIRRRPDKGTYAIKTRDTRKAALHGVVEEVDHEGPVYDLEVEGAHTFVDAIGTTLLHNTDGIYLACGRNGANIPGVAAVYGAEDKADHDDWMTTPEEAVKAVDDLNERFRTELNYREFELEPELHDAMVFVVHKNYLIFDAYDGDVHMETKGNNFKGADKAELARTELAQIMKRALGENLVWQDEEAARKGMQASIKKAAVEAIQKLQVSTVDPDQLLLLQNVRPSRAYKPNPDGSPSTFAKRSDALSALFEKAGLEPLRSARKIRFVVGNRPLPGLETSNKKRPGIKPIEFMWPREIIEMEQFKRQGYRIDLDWYKDMLENYIRGAFGFDDLSTVEQKGLDAWL